MPAPGDPTILMHAEVDETIERSYELMQSNWMALHAGVGGTCFIALVVPRQTGFGTCLIDIMGPIPIDCGGGLEFHSIATDATRKSCATSGFRYLRTVFPNN